MSFRSCRPLVGLVKPTMRPGSFEELVRIVPRDIEFLPLHQHVEKGSEDEFKGAIDAYWKAAGSLAQQEVNLIHLAGTPPFMMLGPEEERKLAVRWKQEFNTHISIAPELDASALRALRVQNLIGVTYSEFQNSLSEAYMREAGFNVLAMEPIKSSFEGASEISSSLVYAHIRKNMLRHPRADGIYIQGNAWRVINIIDKLETDFGVPVVHANCALSWRIQKIFGMHRPKDGFGQLIRQLP
ncbi:MAG: hypothetical protein VW557_01490 [Rhodospirillaceae bacterium]